ncbi:MAG: glycosyltransferase family 39 protein [Acidobacteria bacterium]|nr:glycosyltransferase family 39 protein [Acidobacteriota bacterium]
MPARRLLWVGLLAFALRAAYVLAYPQIGRTCEDCRFYHEVATNVAEGRGFLGGFASETFAGPAERLLPEVGMGPIYPLTIAAVYRTAGRSMAIVALVQALMGALAAVLAALIGSWFGRRTGTIAGVLAAASPALIAYSGVLLTETTLSLLLAAAVCLIGSGDAAHAAGLPPRPRAALAGLVLGVATLLRPECVLLVPLAVAAIWWRGGPARTSAAAVAAIVACLTIAPWTIRNYRVFGRPILVTAVGGNALYIATTGWDEWPADDPELRAIVAGLDYVRQNEALGRAGLANIGRNPGQYLAYSLRRVPVFWISSQTTYVRGLSDRYAAYFERGQHARLAAKLSLLALSLASVALGFAGLVLAWRRGPRYRTLVVAGPIAIVFLVHVFLYASPRYQVPLLPLLLVFAAVAIDRMQSGRIEAAL